MATRWRSSMVLRYVAALAIASPRATQVPGIEATAKPEPPEIDFAPGPAVSPAEAALSFLDRVGSEVPRRRVRVPVALALDDARLAIVTARLGGAGDAPRLQLDDGRLGIGLVDRARDLCAAGAPCVLWIVGHWRGRVDGLGFLDLIRVDGRRNGAAEIVEVERLPAAETRPR